MYEYRVRVRSREIRWALRSPMPRWRPPRGAWWRLGSRFGTWTDEGFRAGPGDTLRLAVEWSNPRRETDSLDISLEGRETSGSRRAACRAATPSSCRCRRSQDIRSGGSCQGQPRRHLDGADTVRILQDVPVADAGRDTTVSSAIRCVCAERRPRSSDAWSSRNGTSATGVFSFRWPEATR